MKKNSAMNNHLSHYDNAPGRRKVLERVFIRARLIIEAQNQYHLTPLESDERLSYLRSESSEELTEIWKL